LPAQPLFSAQPLLSAQPLSTPSGTVFQSAAFVKGAWKGLLENLEEFA
jgi:hypothetical protein